MPGPAGPKPTNTPAPRERSGVGRSDRSRCSAADDNLTSDPSSQSRSDTTERPLYRPRSRRSERRCATDPTSTRPTEVTPWPLPLTSKRGPFPRFLDFRLYFFLNADPTYGRSQARQLRRRHQLLDGPFQGAPSFERSEPLDILALLMRFRTASHEMNVTMGEAPYLLAYRLGGDAEEDFVQETKGPHGSAVGSSFPHTFKYLFTRYAPEDALNNAEMALLTAA